MSEADIHFDFFAFLKGAIKENPDRGAVTYGDVRAEYSGDELSGRADIVVFDDDGDPEYPLSLLRVLPELQ